MMGCTAKTISKVGQMGQRQEAGLARGGGAGEDTQDTLFQVWQLTLNQKCSDSAMPSDVQDLPCPAQAVVKGDGRCVCIAAASVLAKVSHTRCNAPDSSLRPCVEAHVRVAWKDQRLLCHDWLAWPLY